jgi:hypothetical protein
MSPTTPPPSASSVALRSKRVPYDPTTERQQCRAALEAVLDQCIEDPFHRLERLGRLAIGKHERLAVETIEAGNDLIQVERGDGGVGHDQDLVAANRRTEMFRNVTQPRPDVYRVAAFAELDPELDCAASVHIDH